jgi:SAM-dependent methyltransferase
MSRLPHTKIIDIADFADPELQPYLIEMAKGEMARFGLPEPVIIPDSKQWECAMMLRTLTEFGMVREGATLAGIGAGTEETSFVLASKGCVVFPTDRYLEVTPWSDVAPAGMMVRPEQYSAVSYPQGHVIPVHSDARLLSLPENYFDGVYSAGSIEHFGSLEAVAAAAEQIGRILKPGGVAVLSTEFRLDGPNGQRWFSDDCILFTPEMLEKHIIAPSGLELIDKPSFDTSSGTYDSRVVLVDFLEKAKKVETITDKRNAYPNLVLFHLGYLFCSVHLALRKPLEANSQRLMHSPSFRETVQDNALRAAGVLTRQISEWHRHYGQTVPAQPTADPMVAEELRRLADEYTQAKSELADACVRAESEREYAREAIRQKNLEIAYILSSRSFRLTRPLRNFSAYAKQKPVLRNLGVATFRTLRSIKRMTRP